MSLIDATSPARGAVTSHQRLLALRFAARQLDTRRQKRALAQLAGSQRSTFRGRGIEFEEVRGYQPGDDIRAIDWRVTARTGEAHTKMFHEERERPVLIVVDQRAPMRFGSQHCFKAVLAAELAALLAWSALDKSERVGGLLIGDREHWELRPRSSRKNVLSLLAALAKAGGETDGIRETSAMSADFPSLEQSFLDATRSLRRVARPGSSVFLISDFAGASADHVWAEIFQLARHVQITAIHCSDPLEQQLPPAGEYCVTDGRGRAELNTNNAALRSSYADAYADRVANLKHELQRLGVPMLEASTGLAPLTLLRDYFSASGL
ncbi:MAG: DUF58 domain-containing protein [Pseudomonadota bacterium]